MSEESHDKRDSTLGSAMSLFIPMMGIVLVVGFSTAFVEYPQDRLECVILILVGVLMMVLGRRIPKTFGRIDWK